LWFNKPVAQNQIYTFLRTFPYHVLGDWGNSIWFCATGLLNHNT